MRHDGGAARGDGAEVYPVGVSHRLGGWKGYSLGYRKGALSVLRKASIFASSVGVRV